MTDEIELYEEKALAFNGRKAKSTDDEIVRALAPIFVEYPHLEPTEEWLNLRKLMLRDLAPDVLAKAVLAAIAESDFPPSVNLIRKHAESERRPPGPASPVDPAKLKPVPQRMFRLPDDEDKAQRMAQLRRTKGWKYDA